LLTAPLPTRMARTINLVLGLARGDVLEIGRSERDGPVHDDNVVGGLGKGADVVNARGFRAEGERGETNALEETRAIVDKDRVDAGDNGLGEHGLVADVSWGQGGHLH
jgi:hypothetical protein